MEQENFWAYKKEKHEVCYEKKSSLQRLRCLLNLRLSVIINILDFLRNLLEQFLWEYTQQCPSNIQRREDITVLVWSLSQEFQLKLLSELKILVLVFAECFLANNSLHGPSVLTNCIVRIQLVRHVWMIWSGHTLADTRLHKTAERRQHIDWWVDLPVVQRAIHKDLPFGDISSQVWNRMSDVIIRHCQNRELRDGPVTALNTARTLINCRQVGVHVTRIAAAARHLFSCS